MSDSRASNCSRARIATSTMPTLTVGCGTQRKTGSLFFGFLVWAAAACENVTAARAGRVAPVGDAVFAAAAEARESERMTMVRTRLNDNRGIGGCRKGPR